MNSPTDNASAGPRGATVFGCIVTIVRNRTGMDYSRAFNVVLADNRGFLRGPLDATAHTGPLLCLVNRARSATGLTISGSTELAANEVGKLTNQFFPALSNSPTALQWDVLWRTASALEKCGVAQKLFNRTSSADVSKAAWKAANDRAGAALTFLEDREEKSDDAGAGEKFQRMPPQQKWRTFKNEVDRLMREEGLSVADAFAKLKETQPIFWTHAMLSFEPEKQ